ncbi:MAG: Flp pilus assembly complex ATPase component TadA [Planctomycetes bacterium]|nr:Flp pilus assembly complex ATPase component TadA [Planctomycetota bacterium]
MPPIEQLRGRQLGRILIKMGKLRRSQVHEALDIQKKARGPIGTILVELGHITEEDLNLALAAQTGMEAVDLSKRDIPPEVVATMTAQMARTYNVLPIDFDPQRNQVSLAIDNPDNFRATDDLQTLLGYSIKSFLCKPDHLQTALDRYYPEGEQESIAGLIGDLTDDDDLSRFDGRGDSIDLAELREIADLNPIKKLLNLVLLQAIKDKASDIHFEPFEDEFKMRYRIDGVLYEMVPPPKYVALALASRIKVMASLDIAERRLPQDGRIELTVKGVQIDLRVSVIPTMFGESVVLRILDRSNVSLDLGKIGLRDDDLATFRQLMSKPNGIIINTGPTGSGKTTTLYSALSELNDPKVKILTAEDPVEYDIDGLIQTQVHPEVGLTFAKCLRSFLRQDPDIILVGEIRDLETAQISVQAALTGHLVFSTLHTNDAPSTIARLLDLGLEPFLITATLEAIIAQRLVRRICTYCKADYRPTEQQLMELNVRPDDVGDRVFHYGKGCDYCNNTGYRGRLGLYELMPLDDDMHELIMQRASTAVLRREAVKRGMRTLRDSGLLAIYDGITSLDEVVRETLLEEE